MLSTIMNSDPLVMLRKSKFRQSFMLSDFEKQKIREIGLIKIMDDAREIIEKKLTDPIIDGKQTPFFGHPVFKAMHATACCCRKCLFKWHRIGIRHPLTQQEKKYIENLIYRWIRKQLLYESKR